MPGSADAVRRPRSTPRADAGAVVEHLGRAVRARRTTVVAVAGAFVAVTLLLLLVRDATYEASADVLVDLTSGNPTDPNGGAPADPARELQNELRFAQSELLRQAAVERLGTDDVRVTVTAATGEDVLTFTARADSAEEAAAHATGYTETYLDERLRVRSERVGQAAGNLTQRIAEIEARLQALGEGTDAERETLTAQRAELQQELDALVLANELLQTTRGQVIEPATPPSSPVSPRPARDLALALLAGLVVGCGAAVVHEAVDERRGAAAGGGRGGSGRRWRTAADETPPGAVAAAGDGWDEGGAASHRRSPDPAEGNGHGNGNGGRSDERAPRAPAPAAPPRPSTRAVPRLAVIPRAGADVPEPAVASITAPSSSVAQGYRTLRANVASEVLGRDHRTIQVTSVVAGEGRTTTVANLAVELAREGQLVVVVDADLRDPGIHELFRVRNRAGLSSVLAGEAVLADVVRPVHGDDFELFFVPAGPPPADAGKLLAGPRFAEVLGLLRDDADVVLLDSSPLFSVPDARVLARTVDATVLVTRSAETEAEEVRRAAAALDAVRAPLTGTVRIDVGGRRGTAGSGPESARSGLAAALSRGWRRAAASRPLAGLRQ